MSNNVKDMLGIAALVVATGVFLFLHSWMYVL
jgi:hypothetical protein